MNGPYVASVSGGAPCRRCGSKIAVNAQVYYTGSLLDDSGRTCGECVDLDLFGGTS